MSRARDRVTTVLMALLWLIVILSVLTMILGCEGLQERDKREGAFRVDADCAQDRVRVEFELDQHADDKKMKVHGR